MKLKGRIRFRSFAFDFMRRLAISIKGLGSTCLAKQNWKLWTQGH